MSALVLVLVAGLGCGGDDVPVGLAPTPLQRLTPVEYTNTVWDLFPGVPIPELVLVNDP